jgi:hypothetical protein
VNIDDQWLGCEVCEITETIWVSWHHARSSGDHGRAAGLRGDLVTLLGRPIDGDWDHLYEVKQAAPEAGDWHRSVDLGTAMGVIANERRGL